MSLLDHQLELLAPARDADIGIEAVNHGADAVYIGGPSFGARASADNSVSEIARLARHAHRFNSRVFVTLNTILRDDELEPSRKLAWQLYDAGVDALIIQDMGLLQIDLPPIQLHASTQCDIRAPEKARFLQDVGLSQIVLARELSLAQIQAIRVATDPARCSLEFFVHGALCVAYSGQCYISAAHTGRSANRGECNQACRLPYQVMDDKGRFVAHDKHVLSMKDNNQSDNLAALVDVGIRSFKIEGRYKDMGYVKNITAHYRQLLDALIEQRQSSAQPLAPASSGSTTFSFTPDPKQNFNREFTDYFVQGRQDTIGAFDTPKNPGQPIGFVTQVGPNWLEVALNDAAQMLHNGDGLCYYDLQKELVGLAINRAENLNAGKGRWRVFPKDPLADLKDLRKGVEVNRNRDTSWVRRLEKKSSDRRIGVWAQLSQTPQGLALSLTDEDGVAATAHTALPRTLAKDKEAASASVREHLSKMGDSIFSALAVQVDFSQPWFVPSSVLNPLRRQAVQALEAERTLAWRRLPRAAAVEPPAPYPEDTLSYLANVFNQNARAFYAHHGVKLIAPAYEDAQETGEVSLMITKHCVRFSLSLCPKQAKGVLGVQGTVKAEPLLLLNGKDKLTLRFDCKPCEMHVMGKIKTSVLQQTIKARAPAPGEAPIHFHSSRPAKTTGE
ncbi:MAG: U32 family peptidase [Gammaproteobacteria bacterium]|uniref:peptidase U32 family protein n=1 Tax=Rhodoferax sp. TaxID=50421 RepID=UPI0017A8C18A|nr:U32 family peptidase [Rhodoferax sp.]MBU3900920.1 U32 family peptidase [Gammaproteobacteria bacterium]MBA3057454.1 U32 family peptidase [Rhodoferax sp.]MBU3996851.1 U32 family peptidase [Gammaproteobacteria bacterium]MBU4017594.1 U32 family peptidase [Gammaproteobacteria bacterium]MBU4081037.1 U32 family peptidase [Gammaproteobacteria bacterium]